MKSTNKKPKVYVDMDGVLCDYYNAYKRALIENPSQKYPQSQWGFFLKLEVIEDAIESYKMLETKYDVRILTRPSFRNVNCYTEKAQWIWDKLGFEALENSTMTGDKSELGSEGDFLIDDQNNANQSEFKGEWIHFATEKYPTWKSVTNYLMNK